MNFNTLFIYFIEYDYNIFSDNIFIINSETLLIDRFKINIKVGIKNIDWYLLEIKIYIGQSEMYREKESFIFYIWLFDSSFHLI